MMRSFNKQQSNARVFISYSRDDGEEFASTLRMRLEDEGIPIWQDRVGMEGGKGWWQQITEALDVVEFLILVITHAAIDSEMVQKEWRYARQEGVCIYPIKRVTDLDFNLLPHWMRTAHFYDVDREWQKLVSDLSTRCQQPRVPFMVEDLPVDYIPRPREYDALIDRLLDQQREEPIAITATLRGAGGYGKTTMAKALCHDERIQQAFGDGILWVTLGENPGNLVGKVEDLIYLLKKEPPGFTGIDAAESRLAAVLDDHDILLVVDDVWDSMHLKPFLQGGKRCARLITTRNENVLPAYAQRLMVDAMQPEEAVQLFSFGVHTGVITANERRALRSLVTRLGKCALLLKLANGVLRFRIDRGETLTNALVYLNKALDKRGLTAFDEPENTLARDRAVKVTLRVSFDLLQKEQLARYQELAIFPQDVDIPLATLVKLWGATSGMDDYETEELCHLLYRHSLLLNFDLTARTVRLHDMIRSYLLNDIGDNLPTLHAHLLDAYAPTRWADLPDNEPYMWDHLAAHLVAAGWLDKLVATVKDGSYLAKKTYFRSVYALETDLDVEEIKTSNDESLQLLRRTIARISHLLNQCETLQEVEGVLHSRLSPLVELSGVCNALEQDLQGPFLTSWHAFMDLSHPALIRTLEGHQDWVRECTISSIGDQIVSASSDKTLKVWDAHTGKLLFNLEGHNGVVNGCAVSPDGNWIVSASSDETLKIWDAHTRQEVYTLKDHIGEVYDCAVSPDGNWIVSASSDETLKIWDVHTGRDLNTLKGHTQGVYGCVVSSDGNWIISASYDRTLKVWNAHTGALLRTLSGHREGVEDCSMSSISPDRDFIVSASNDYTLMVWDAQVEEENLTMTGHQGVVHDCAVSPRADYIVSASSDETLKVWDTQKGSEYLNLVDHTEGVNGCAISPDGSWIVSASSDKTLKVWDAHTGDVLNTLEGHKEVVNGCAISPKGEWIVSVSFDKILKVWDAHTGAVLHTLKGHTSRVNSCAVSPDGKWIVSASDDFELKLWDTQTGLELHTLQGNTDWVYGCAVSPDGSWIVSASFDKTLKLWDVQSRTCLMTLRTGGVLQTCAFCPDGMHLVVGGKGGVYFLKLIQ